MKVLSFFTGILFLYASTSYAQDTIVFKGTVRCFISDDERSTKGARNVVVIPGFIPQKAGITGEQGYYEVKTIPIRQIEDKYVRLYYVSACNQCKKDMNVFVSSEQITRGRIPTLAYVNIETIKMNAGCKKTELSPSQSDSIYNSFIKQPSADLDKVSALNTVTAAPSFLNLLTQLALAPIIVNSGTFFVRDSNAVINQGIVRENFGGFLFASPMIHTANIGFNFSPARDLSESVFWNPAALANSSHAGAFNLFTNIKNNIKASGSARINDRFTLGAGGIYTQQDEFRPTLYTFLSDTVSHLRKLKEYAVFLSPSYKLSHKISVGIAVKSVWQTFNIPKAITITTNPNKNDFTDSTVKKQYFNADISFSYRILPALQIGVNVMNVAGDELYADASVTMKQGTGPPVGIPVKKQRSLGIGLCYKWRQFNLGTDVLITEDDLYDVSVGANYVPFNNGLISAGYVFKHKTFSASFRWKQFRVSYIDDNGLMQNQEHPGKSSILDGHIYTGCVFNF